MFYKQIVKQMVLSFFVFLLTCSQLCFAGSIVDSTGATITVKDPQRIVTLSGNVTETVFTLGLGEKVIGVDASSVYPEAATKKEQVGYHRRVSAEGILSLAPDLIIATSDSGPPNVIEQIRASGIPIAILTGEHTLDGAQKRIEQISKLLDKEKEGHLLVWGMHDKMKFVLKHENPPRVLFVYARGAGTQNVAGAETGADTMIKLAGGQNAVTEYTGYKPMNAEAIIAAAPDYILFTERGLQSVGGAEEVLKMNGIAQTPAGEKKNIISLDDLVLLGFGPRTAEGVIDLSKMLQE